ncbi:MAG: DUF1648 domain-containing protein [bacterium]
MDYYKYLTIFCYIVPLILAINIYRKCSENYAKLPDRIPLHFGFSGKPDRWAKKSALTVYWIPAMVLGMDALMFVSLYYLPSKTDPWPEMMLIGGLMNLAIAYMFYRINDGIIEVALGMAANIMPYMKLPIVLVIATSVSMCFPLFIGGTPKIVEHTICASVGRNLEPVDVREVFKISDPAATIRIKWEFLNGKKTVRYEWRDPDGKLAYAFDYTPGRNRIMRTRRTWCSMRISGSHTELKTGNWTIDVFLNGKPVLKSNFTLTR